jgi:hypothetical protein
MTLTHISDTDICRNGTSFNSSPFKSYDEIVKLLGEGRDAKELADAYKVSIATFYNFRTLLKLKGAPVAPK